MDMLIVGCGYLGSRVAERWCAEGHRVFATTRGRAEPLRGLGLEPIVCDVLDPPSLGALPVADTVVYCVGLDRGAGRSMAEVYVDGLRNVLAALPRPRRFLYVSSTSVYGQTDGEEVDEQSATVPTEASGQIVLAAEELVRASPLPWMVLRFAGIYGPGRLLRRASLERGEPIAGDPEKWLNLIHVDDGATAVQVTARTSQSGTILNVSDGEPVRRRDFYSELAGLLGAPPPKFVPSPPDPTDRRIVSLRLREVPGVSFRYPNYRVGLAAAWEVDRRRTT